MLLLLLLFQVTAVCAFCSDICLQFSSVQGKMVSIRSEKPIWAPPRLSEVSPTLPLKRCQCSSDWRWPSGDLPKLHYEVLSVKSSLLGVVTADTAVARFTREKKGTHYSCQDCRNPRHLSCRLLQPEPRQRRKGSTSFKTRGRTLTRLIDRISCNTKLTAKAVDMSLFYALLSRVITIDSSYQFNAQSTMKVTLGWDSRRRKTSHKRHLLFTSSRFYAALWMKRTDLKMKLNEPERQKHGGMRSMRPFILSSFFSFSFLLSFSSSSFFLFFFWRQLLTALGFLQRGP